MKKLFAFMVLGGLIIGCGDKKEKKDSFEVTRPKKEVKEAKAQPVGVPVDMNNKGVGPIKSVKFDAEINKDLAAKGEKTFSTICVACHMPDQKLIGPALKGIYDRRSPEWVMNMILVPDQMIKEDPIAKALVAENNNAIMINQNLSEEDARAVAEYLRTF
ncbi:cytochrome c [Flavobacteriaceae bacterium F89]|uniref:Cytochrome c n=1 Tax=Cerina litoralis TaxID=2874477 RepID=A0AAE3JN22_9FLAO|nr:cytochrome c [Cerina litoralis]MCG2459421.1 cytochrome c [Cerina litoralis]